MNNSTVASFAYISESVKNISMYQPGDRIGGLGYFNYNPHDLRYGPGNPIVDKLDKLIYPKSQWPFVSQSVEEMYWRNKYGDLLGENDDDLRNECWWNGRQSPIDLCDEKVTKKCEGK
jgi:hypothetical protein